VWEGKNQREMVEQDSK
jgi:hypothetical protein